MSNDLNIAGWITKKTNQMTGAGNEHGNEPPHNQPTHTVAETAQYWVARAKHAIGINNEHDDQTIKEGNKAAEAAAAARNARHQHDNEQHQSKNNLDIAGWITKKTNQMTGAGNEHGNEPPHNQPTHTVAETAQYWVARAKHAIGINNQHDDQTIKEGNKAAEAAAAARNARHEHDNQQNQSKNDLDIAGSITKKWNQITGAGNEHGNEQHHDKPHPQAHADKPAQVTSKSGAGQDEHLSRAEVLEEHDFLQKCGLDTDGKEGTKRDGNHGKETKAAEEFAEKITGTHNRKELMAALKGEHGDELMAKIREAAQAAVKSGTAHAFNDGGLVHATTIKAAGHNQGAGAGR